MYNVTQAFIDAVAVPGQIYNLRGKIGNINFDESAVAQGSLVISGQASSSTDVNVGSVFISTMTAVIFPDVVPLPRGAWTGKEIKIEIGLQLDDETFEWVPFQSFTIQEANWALDGVEITAVDYMAKFDKPCVFPSTTGTALNLLQYICSKCMVELGMDQTALNQLPNGNQVFTFDTRMEGSIKTYRDLLSALAVALGSFATIGRDNRLVLRRFSIAPSGEVDADVRYTGGTYSDYLTRYTGISVVEEDTNTTRYYHAVPDDGLTMNLGRNPFLQLGIPEVVNTIRLRILEEVNRIRYTPFAIDTVPNPAIDLGDHLTFPNGIASGIIGCVMSYELTYKDGLMLEGYGKNPALATAQSKTDKAISGLNGGGSSSTGTVGTVKMTNLQEVAIGTDWQDLGTLGFYAGKQQTALFHGVVKVSLQEPGNVRVRYLLNSEPENFIHEEYAHATDTLTLFFPIDVEPDKLENLKIQIQGDTAGTVSILNMHGAVIGAGVYMSTWDGTIKVSDDFRRIRNENALIREMYDSKALKFYRVKEPTATDAFSRLHNKSAFIRSLVDDKKLQTFRDDAQRVTEDGIFRVTEDGEIRITTGGFQDG